MCGVANSGLLVNLTGTTLKSQSNHLSAEKHQRPQEKSAVPFSISQPLGQGKGTNTSLAPIIPCATLAENTFDPFGLNGIFCPLSSVWASGRSAVDAWAGSAPPPWGWRPQSLRDRWVQGARVLVQPSHTSQHFAFPLHSRCHTCWQTFSSELWEGTEAVSPGKPDPRLAHGPAGPGGEGGRSRQQCQCQVSACLLSCLSLARSTSTFVISV